MKTKYLLYILLLASLECGMNLQAQTKLTGTVVDKENRSLVGVSVDFNNGFMKTTTDTDGKFTISYPDTLKSRRIGSDINERHVNGLRRIIAETSVARRRNRHALHAINAV